MVTHTQDLLVYLELTFRQLKRELGQRERRKKLQVPHRHTLLLFQHMAVGYRVDGMEERKMTRTQKMKTRARSKVNSNLYTLIINK